MNILTAFNNQIFLATAYIKVSFSEITDVSRIIPTGMLYTGRQFGILVIIVE